ncbi:MAG TPA: 6-phosphogluconolactonase [Candidatus Obscuribacterales bacterium]
MSSEVHVLPSPEAAGVALAQWTAGRLWQAANMGHGFHLALAGGSTPIPFFTALGQMADLPWQQLWLYWSDERCVPPNHPESNYGLARRHLLTRAHVPKQQIERLRGEIDPEVEARRYGELLRQRLPQQDRQPILDLILLGLGEDGHTASLFPGDDDALASHEPCTAVIHPLSGQLRLSMTPGLINRARAVAFLVTGAAKAGILARVRNPGRSFPAQHIHPAELHFFVDAAAAGRKA